MTAAPNWPYLLYIEHKPVWASGTHAPEPEPEPEPQPGMIQGDLRVITDSHFADDTGEMLPLRATYGPGLERMRSDLAQCGRELDAFAQAGYQGVRTWFTLGWYEFWRGHEVPPIGFTARDGVHVPAWHEYEHVVVDFAEALRVRGMRLFWSCGDLQMFDDDAACSAWARRCGELLADSGVVVAADVNEAWQNWIGDARPSPVEIDDVVIDPFSEGYRKPFIRLCSASDEDHASLDRWARDTSQKHGHRGDTAEDHVTVIRHARGINYDDDGHPRVRLGWESEPPGPDIDRQGHQGMGPINNVEAQCLLAVANYMAPYAFVWHSHRGVLPWKGPIEDQPGFLEVPRVRSLLPPDLASAYRLITHGGKTHESPFTDVDGFPESANRRVDSVLSDGGRFVTLVYDETGRTVLQALWNVSFVLYTPHTHDAHPFPRVGQTRRISDGWSPHLHELEQHASDN